MADASRPDDALASPEVATVPVLLTAAGGLVFLAFTMTAFGFVYARYGPSRSSAPPQEFPAPQLLPDDSASEVRSLAATQSERLESYGWANSKHTLVAIPIERAMAIIAGRGAKAFEPIAPAAPKTSGAKP
jgi:hypothetical protein